MPTLGREVGGCALMFGCYEAFKRQAAHVQVYALNIPPSLMLFCELQVVAWCFVGLAVCHLLHQAYVPISVGDAECFRAGCRAILQRRSWG